MMISYLNKPNLVTLTGMIVALASCFLASKGYLNMAMVGLIVAGICDLFDGFVARQEELSEEEQAFGAQLDSLNDVVCFGVLPITILNQWINNTWFFPIFAVYLIAVLFRLAYFNVHGTQTETEDPEAQRYYTGLPVTYVALVIPLLGLLAIALPDVLSKLYLSLLCLGLSAAYTLQYPVPKPGGKAYLAFPILALVTALIWFWAPWGPLA